MNHRTELTIFGILLLALNLPLWFGGAPWIMVYDAAAIGQGEWWRVFTHPLVHVSLYHLLLDGSAFLMLYGMLEEPRRTRRWAIVVAAGGGSLAAVSVSGLSAAGFCGLSGIAHGLMGVVCLDLLDRSDRDQRFAGQLGLALVTGKSMIEGITGRVFLSSLHLGDVGMPLAVCHLGGLIGGVGMYLWLRHRLVFPMRLARTGSR
jgi:rhomboid family GlyGly-CTERM serine protease